MGASSDFAERSADRPRAIREYQSNGLRSKRRSSTVDPEVALAWTAHEVRAPLLAVRHALERVIARSGGLAAADRRLLRSSTEELDRLSGSVESLLSLSLTPLVLHPERVNLVRLVREAVASCTVDGGSDRVWVKAPSSIPIVADKASLRAAIANVVRNGIGYSPESTTVIIEVRRRNGVATILVKDSGPGVDPSEREAIFRPFVRGRAGRRTAGTGVGLALAKQVVEAHQGTITVRANGSGSVFEIRVGEAAE